MPGWFYCDLYSFFLLIFIIINVLQNIENRDRQQRAFIHMLETTVLLIILDMMTKATGRSGILHEFARSTIGLSFALVPLPLVFWMRYVGCALFPGNEERADKWVSAFSCIFLANVILSVSSIVSGLVFYFDSSNLYHRGPLFFVPMLLMTLMLLFSEIFILANHARIEARHIFTLQFFAVPPLACGILQALNYGSSLTLSGLSFSELIVFVHIQNGNINIDYLTGAYNRRKLDRHMRECVRSSSSDKTFAAILIDLDNFKLINDQFGHDVGDLALADTVAILRESIRTNDLLARYGGDEFCIVLDLSSEEELEAIIVRIYERLDRFNAESNRPYKLSFSMGYRVYDVRSGKNAFDFQKEIDDLMYAHKRRRLQSANANGTQ
jgi:diguanylate cyclase (GGDEF)-like protein